MTFLFRSSLNYFLITLNNHPSISGTLVVWDVRTGEIVREVKLDCSNSQLSPKIMLPACGSVICDYGNQMRIVRFPLVAADKCD